jgi:hypothetical protein
VSDTITVSDALERAAGKLDLVTKELYRSTAELEQAEEAWEEKWDEVAEDLEEEWREKGRKSAPSKDAILSRTRKLYRKEYHRMRRAKRELERAQTISQNRRQQTSAYQTMFNNLGAEAQVQDYLSQRVEESVG